MKKLLAVLLLIFTTASYADTETIKWYVDGSVYDTTMCQSGGNVTLPTAPSKTGYTFAGWLVALYDFTTFDKSINGNEGSGSNTTWSVEFPYGKVAGESLCSTSANGSAVVDETNSGSYCWCKATTFTPSGSTIIHENSSTSVWAFCRWIGSTCSSTCANRCGHDVRSLSDLRQRVFGSAS